MTSVPPQKHNVPTSIKTTQPLNQMLTTNLIQYFLCVGTKAKPPNYFFFTALGFAPFSLSVEVSVATLGQKFTPIKPCLIYSFSATTLVMIAGSEESLETKCCQASKSIFESRVHCRGSICPGACLLCHLKTFQKIRTINQ